jgi:hypothetical protein
LIALVAPVFALAGVVVGQLLQRRTTREQLEAQRRSTQEQLAEQRRTLELTWSREDKHRWTADKRRLYAEMLTAGGKAQDVVAEAYYYTRRHVEELEAANGHQADDEERRNFAKEQGYVDRFLVAMNELENLRNQVALIAPSRVQMYSGYWHQKFESAWSAILASWSPEDVETILTETGPEDHDILMRAMRADLGEESEDFSN